MPKLFGEDEESNSDIEIKTNTEYATNYDKWRQKEELNKLKTKYGDVALSESDDYTSSSSEDDEDGVALTEDFEKDFFKTLACLKKRDPCIYDNEIKFFNNETVVKTKKTDKKQDPLLLKDYEKKMVSKTGGKFDNDDDDDDEDERAESPTYVEEQRNLKESFQKALNDDETNGNDWGGMFKKREKTKEEQQNDDDGYTQWLTGRKNDLGNKDVENDLKPLKEYWTDPKLNKDESFLRDYLLNKRYLEKEDSSYVPTYEEVVHDSDDNLSEDEKNIENQEEFETKYNHRYEEPDQEFIKRYPRTMQSSVRKTDDRRKVKRQEVKERKEKEKQQKQEELKQLKSLKRKEIEEKIRKLQEITGNNDLAFQDNDLEEDFDPEAHDRRMKELFDDVYYKGEEGDLKPEFSDIREELGPWADNNEPHCEDDNFIMDCDYDPSAPKETASKKKRNRFDKNTKNVPEIDENDERYEHYLDELYKLDYEDMIGDMPCRFKYREVVPNSFGLSVEEILVAKDRELNRWCSLKKTTQHRLEHVERYEVVAYNKKAQNDALKKKILPSLFEEMEEPKEEEYIQKIKSELEKSRKESEESEQVPEVAKKKKVKKSKKNDIAATTEEVANDDITQSDEEGKETVVVEKKKKKKSKATATIATTEVQTSIETKRKKNKMDDTEATKITSVVDSTQNDSVEVQNSKLSRRQKKNKKKLDLKKETPVKESTNENNKSTGKKRKRKNSEQPTNGEIPKKKPKHNKRNKVDDDKQLNLSNKRLEAYGFNPKKFRNKMKYKNKSN